MRYFKLKIFSIVLFIAMFSLVPYVIAYEGSEISGGGSISGKAIFLGTAPARELIEITKDKEVCAAKEHLSDLLLIHGIL